jgi:SnoaL-like domain
VIVECAAGVEEDAERRRVDERRFGKGYDDATFLADVSRQNGLELAGIGKVVLADKTHDNYILARKLLRQVTRRIQCRLPVVLVFCLDRTSTMIYPASCRAKQANRSESGPRLWTRGRYDPHLAAEDGAAKVSARQEDADMATVESERASESISELGARLRRLEDTESIRRLFIEYGRLADAKDWAGYSELFVEEGVFDSPHSVGTVTGSQEIRERLGNAYSDDPADGIHLFDNVEIEVDGDHATAKSCWTYLRPGSNGYPPQVLMFGQYRDELIRTDAGWKFRVRRCAI